MVVSTQICFTATTSSISMMPLEAPVITREIANKMYTPTAGFLGRFLSTAILQMPIPVVMIIIIFWNIGIDTSIENFGYMVLFSILANFVFNGQGYFLGIVTNDDTTSKDMNVLLTMIFMTGNGVLCNLKDVNWFIHILAVISPLRYLSEAFLRCVT
jgi:hypothetical protein